VHGLTLLTVALAATPLLGRRAVAGGVAVLAVWAGLGAWRLGQPAGPAPGLTVLLVQGNVEQGQKWDRGLMAAIFDRYLALTREAVAASAEDIVVRFAVTVFYRENNRREQAAAAVGCQVRPDRLVFEGGQGDDVDAVVFRDDAFALHGLLGNLAAV
jgi:apolipoprotein N-acyltransferase